MSPCSRVCPPRNKSSAQPAATHQGTAMPDRWRATSPGDQQDDHRASSASLSAGENSMPPRGNCSCTGEIYQRTPRLSLGLALTESLENNVWAVLRVAAISFGG